MTKKSMPLSELVRNGDLSEKAMQNLKGQWITDVNQLFGFIEAGLRSMSKQELGNLGDILGISSEKLGSFMEYIRPYVVEQKTLDVLRQKEYPTNGIPIRRTRRLGESYEDNPNLGKY